MTRPSRLTLGLAGLIPQLLVVAALVTGGADVWFAALSVGAGTT